MKKLTASLWFTAVAAMFVACSDRDNPVQPSAVDDGTWTIDEAKDLTVKPGDDFFTYCNGTWIANTPLNAQSPDIVGYFYTEMAKDIHNMGTVLGC